ncbi:MAG: 30S ribosomal protein S17 [Planctomycetes bacterium]|nr:30S ribosomal protein S17 [Planctomycetota bacterium]NQU48631.1 30S ribosomal protein S17 [Planctomycetota bacterium]
MTEPTQEATATRGTRRVMEGVVVSDRGDKTLVVQVERTTRHALYHKILRKRKKYHVHDEANQAKAGDKVEIMGTRPLSKLKRWRLVRIIEKADQA